MESEFRGTLYDANMYMRIRMCDTRATNYDISKNARTNGNAPKWESSQNSDWEEEKMYGETEKKVRVKRRKERSIVEGARKEAASSRMQDADGFTWLESTKTSDDRILNFFITGSCTRQIISRVVYAGI